MMKIYVAAVLSLMGLLIGCADEMEAEAVAPMATPRVEYRIDGVSAEEFYSQFNLKSLNNCGPVKTYLGMNSRPVRIAVNQYGEDVTAQVSILLGVDRRYALLYQETQIFVSVGGLVRQTVTRTQTLTGVWSVAQDRLLLSALAEGTGGQVDGRPMIQLQMRRDVLSPGLEGRKFQLATVSMSALFAADMDPCGSRKP